MAVGASNEHDQRRHRHGTPAGLCPVNLDYFGLTGAL